MDLVNAVEDMINRILIGNWERIDVEEEDDEYYYYVIGLDEYYKHISDFSSDQLPIRKEKWEGPSPQVQKYFRSLLAAQQPNYLSRAVKRLKDTGLVREGGKDSVKILFQQLPEDPLLWDQFNDDQIEALADYFDAWLADRGRPEDLPQGIEAHELEQARDKLYLREISNKYKGVISRLQRLTPLSFESEQLNEATRCWLYGFYRASIVLSASALEEILKKATKNLRLDTNEDRIVKILGSESAEAEMAKNVFRKRNAVVHESLKAEARDAKNILDWARGVISFILDHH